ncbi:MAG TPA: UDP-N-acetylglucosamine 2-epimerase [Chryseosolibacter sp.]
MRIALLTSSRADYSIYYPLLTAMKNDDSFDVDIIAFGTHNSLFYGQTSRQIEHDGFAIKHKVESLILGESPQAVADSMGLTMMKFSQIWATSRYDLCLTLGDRYEMFAAAYSTLPFNIPVAHISGGERTLGAIDNSFRDALTVLSKYHFTSTEQYATRVAEILGHRDNVFNVGALSIDNLKRMPLLSVSEFKTKFNIDLSIPSILITFHPETVSFEKNEDYIQELIAALDQVKEYQLIITMPNADTMGNVIREHLNAFIARASNAIGVESFGTIGYLSCMKHCSFMLGNTSSGFVEASFFPKYVINLGDRQKGRIETPNINTVPIVRSEILSAIGKFNEMKTLPPVTVYGDGTAAHKILSALRSTI